MRYSRWLSAKYNVVLFSYYVHCFSFLAGEGGGIGGRSPSIFLDPEDTIIPGNLSSVLDFEVLSILPHLSHLEDKIIPEDPSFFLEIEVLSILSHLSHLKMV